MPSLDYQFAKEFYGPSDSRYKLIQYFDNLIWETKKIRMYNCKIEIIETAENLYNVYLYFCDLKKTLGNDYKPFFNENTDFIVLFYKALKECPVAELNDKKLNSNGIFVKDFQTCARSYAINNALPKFEHAIKKRYPTIEFLTVWDQTIYLFFHDRGELEKFLEGDIPAFKKFCYDIIKPFDIENVWETSKLAFMLDIYENYRSIGGRNYFNSDAMGNGVFI
ncbi:hypothetical protein [Desulfosporosinus fructosivorans]